MFNINFPLLLLKMPFQLRSVLKCQSGPQVLPLMGYIFEASYRTSATRTNQNSTNQSSYIYEQVLKIQRYTNAHLKIFPYVCVHVKIISWKFRILNRKNSRVTLLVLFMYVCFAYLKCAYLERQKAL